MEWSHKFRECSGSYEGNLKLILVMVSSSVVKRLTVNRLVVGLNPTWGFEDQLLTGCRFESYLTVKCR